MIAGKGSKGVMTQKTTFECDTKRGRHLIHGWHFPP